MIPCNLCGSQDNLQRQAVKQMLAAWERESPGRTDVIFRALQNVSPSQLADPGLFDFASLVPVRAGAPADQAAGGRAAEPLASRVMPR